MRLSTCLSTDVCILPFKTVVLPTTYPASANICRSELYFPPRAISVGGPVFLFGTIILVTRTLCPEMAASFRVRSHGPQKISVLIGTKFEQK